ncbi:hypothetical protein EG68_06371 [Paragonimus skrjabini miyazakii]|uniref:tRNA dimethylallyltransferase n=1 Tax=Paragonimus skrjabini miyazakii TaxID=59628 RepID=A0A8S9YPX1_9TREM|nr:hypothetical protein EG68_06371 [Paragonimus skrjabini miyazakii]
MFLATVYKYLFKRDKSFTVMLQATAHLSGLPPVVAVCGSTGTGKSKLAVDLARIFSGEVINSDAIQLYEGLSIATNKVTEEEAAGITHHLLGTFSAQWAAFGDVHKYKAACLPLVDKIRTNIGRIPILVGGTHYYLEAILWSDFLAAYTSSNEEGESRNILLPSEMSDCYTLLQKLNPQIASQLHPNNERKVRKALREALLSSSKQPSTSMGDDLKFGYPRNRSYHPRYPDDTLILWVDCDLAVLDARLDSRVDNMVRTGLIHELDLFLKNYFTEREFSKSNQTRSDQLNRLFTETCSVNDPSGRRGILQTIGFKEFADYLSLPPGSAERESQEGQQMLTAAIEKVKVATRQYARRQIKWITNRFLRRPEFGCIPVYRLDVTESMKSTTGLSSDTWDINILAPACRLIFDHLVDSGALAQLVIGNPARLNTLLDLCPPSARPRPCDFLPMRDDSAQIGAGSSVDCLFSCTVCGNRLFFRRADFEEHMRSRSHQKRISKLRRRQLLNSIKC